MAGCKFLFSFWCGHKIYGGGAMPSNGRDQ
jgi:hypothetical protein